MCILSEIGNDMSVFVKLPIWWVWRLCPRNDESAGKIQSRKTMHGNKYPREILIQREFDLSFYQSFFIYYILIKIYRRFFIEE